MRLASYVCVVEKHSPIIFDLRLQNSELKDGGLAVFSSLACRPFESLRSMIHVATSFSESLQIDQIFHHASTVSFYSPVSYVDDDTVEEHPESNVSKTTPPQSMKLGSQILALPREWNI